ncbi:MAG: serine hydrolase domain-containing protein [Bacteroidia bacterium]
MKSYILSFLFFTLWGTLNSQILSPEQQKSLDDLILEFVDEGDPGLAMGIVQNGQITYTKYAGVSDLKNETAIDAQSRFNIASLAKQFTALCILKLESEQKLKLSDDIRKYLPNFFFEIKSPITIAQLLNHSSGIRNVYDLWRLQGITWWKQTLTNEDAIQILSQQQELNFFPGTRYLYSNSNYILLAEIVKVVSGMSFQAYADQMFAELRMKATHFESNHDQIENMALPYFNFGKWTTFDWLSDLHGDGALFTTLEDQLRWEQIVQNMDTSVLGREILKKSQSLIAGSQITEYGYGLEFGSYRGLAYRFHEGETGAWHATTLRFDSEQLSIFVMSNSGRVGTDYLARLCADLLIDANKLASESNLLEPENKGAVLPISDLAGTYKTDWGYYLKIVNQAGEWSMQRSERDDIQLEMEGDNLFHEVGDSTFKQWFSLDKENNYQIRLYHPSHSPYSLQKIESDFTAFDYTSFNGKYLNPETGAELIVEHDKDDQYKIVLGGDKMNARMFEPDVLVMNGYRLLVQRSKTGKVKNLLLYSRRLQEVRFTP